MSSHIYIYIYIYNVFKRSLSICQRNSACHGSLWLYFKNIYIFYFKKFIFNITIKNDLKYKKLIFQKHNNTTTINTTQYINRNIYITLIFLKSIYFCYYREFYVFLWYFMRNLDGKLNWNLKTSRTHLRWAILWSLFTKKKNTRVIYIYLWYR